MRREIENLWKQAEKDLEVAEKNLMIKEYYASVFFCQQAVEKALKAIFILKKSKSPGQTHSLIYLAKEIKAPKEFYGFLQSLTPEFVTTIYPDITNEAPYELYNEEKADNYINRAKG